MLLVGGFKHDFYFPFHIWDVIVPIDELHHFSRWAHCTINQATLMAGSFKHGVVIYDTL